MNTTHAQQRLTNIALVVNTFAVFSILTLILIVIDFVPEPVTESPSITVLATTVAPIKPNTISETTVPIAETQSPQPVRIVIEDIGVDTSISNPNSTDIEVLDRALLSGAVRYPGSGELGTDANVLIFGHSSYLPVVKNKAYKAFNEIGTLERGDEVVVYSDTHRYVYTVETVRLANAEEALVEFSAQEPMLTLATCNTFGAKQERWVVTASLAHFDKML